MGAAENTIDQAIENCEKRIIRHRDIALYAFIFGVVVIIAFGCVVVYSFKQSEAQKILIQDLAIQSKIVDNEMPSIKDLLNGIKNKEDLDHFHALYSTDIQIQQNFIRRVDSLQAKSSTEIKDFNQNEKSEKFLYYLLYAIFILIFGVVVSIYRFQLKEIAKYEHFLFGLHRIRVAGNNYENGFASEVRISLTQDAFSTIEGSTLFKKEKKIESPIQGYPLSDLSTSFINKLMEEYEFVKKPRP